ncbi:nitroreductase family protein [Priestia koreensis]|uniref:nitroreductase family protein n=1 Tax=Priestia koreensis TaxID=284581 RepID=UPI00345828FA
MGMNFEQLVSERRSANNFLEGNPITKEELANIFKQVKLAPSAFNLQHARYIVVLDAEKRKAIKAIAYGQHKVGTASAIVVVLGDKKAYEHVEKIYEGLRMLGVIKQEEYDEIVRSVLEAYENGGEKFQENEAIRNASLSAMLFMLAAKDQGWDTCPMIGFDSGALKEFLQLPQHLEPVMLIAIGKEKVQSRRPRGYRKPVEEFVSFI